MRIMAFFLSLSLILFSAFKLTTAAEEVNPNTSRLIKEEAEKFVNAVGSKFDTWKDSRPGEMLHYTPSEEGMDFYNVSILLNGKDVGFLVIASVDKEAIIYEASFEPSPHKMFLRRAKDVAQNTAGANRRLGEPELFYLGANTHIARFSFYFEEKLIGNLPVDLLRAQIIHLNKPPVLDKKGEAFGKTVAEGSPHAISATMIDDVPHYGLYLTDQATALAMIFGYWERHGFPDLRQTSREHPSQKESDDEFIAAVARCCGECGSMTAVQLFSSSRGYYAHTESFYRGLEKEEKKKEAALSLVKKEIESGSPILFRTTAAGVQHYLVIVGWLETSFGYYLVCLSPKQGETTSHAPAYHFLHWNTPFDHQSFTIIRPKKEKQ